MEAVSISTRVSGRSCMISRQASTPSLCGSITSMTMTSGARLCTILTASTPSRASPTTSKSPSSCRASRRSSLMMGWSSASITLICFVSRHPGLPSTATCRVSRIGCSHICAAGHTTEVADLWRPALGSRPTTSLGPAHGAGVCPRWRRQARSTCAPPSSASACSGRRPRQSWRAAPPGWRRSARTRS